MRFFLQELKVQFSLIPYIEKSRESEKNALSAGNGENVLERVSLFVLSSIYSNFENKIHGVCKMKVWFVHSYSLKAEFEFLFNYYGINCSAIAFYSFRNPKRKLHVAHPKLEKFGFVSPCRLFVYYLTAYVTDAQPHFDAGENGQLYFSFEHPGIF